MVMRRIVFILLVIIIALKSNGQEESKRNLNFIIMIDGNIPFQGDVNLQLSIKNKLIETIRVNYIPGDIILDDSAFNKIISMEEKSFRLEIYYSKLHKNKIKSYYYNIILEKSWLKNSFNILRIYNLENKKNKKTFSDIEDRDYTYEIDSPNGSILRVKR